MTAAAAIPFFGDRYRVERELGRGGMATVYLCTDTKFGRQVAIKLLHPELGAAVGAERFHREIHIATGLSHPNILPAFDSGQTEEGHLYYVMPFVEGESLRDRLERERQLPVEDAIRITMQVASALQHAHSRQIIHRDIKPENILLQGHEAIVADFGIARAVTSASEGAALTQTGVSVGTPTYMSPEQAMGERNIDGRADQYSLACVTYEMLTGQPPFVASTLQMLVMKHVGEPVPLISTVRPAVPEELEDVILRALEKVPADRFPTVGDFGDALAGTVTTTGTWARRTPNRTAQMRATRRHAIAARDGPRRRRWIAGGAGVLLAAVTAGAWLWNSSLARGSSDANADRVAVLYFQDESGGRMRDLADGLTESLIDRLTAVPVLSVVSRNGVLPLRGREVPVDSVRRLFNAGSIVQGTVEPSSRGAHITVRLLDGSGALIERKAFEFDSTRGQVLALGDSLALQLAEFLQERIGREVRLRERRRATRSQEAWLLVQRAEARLKDADSLRLHGAAPQAFTVLEEADSLLARAEHADARWPTPPALRAAVAIASADAIARDPTRLPSLIDSGIAHADRALAIDSRDPDAMEYKGRLLYLRITGLVVTDPRESDRVLAQAESLLTMSVTVNRSQAGAWDALSALHYRKPDLQAVIYAAEKAYEADAFMRSARDILIRLFLASYNLELFPEAMRKLREFERRFPNDPYAIEARLLMYRAKGQPADPDSAWTYLDELVKRLPPANREMGRRRGQIYVAGALARAALTLKNPGLADSARAVLLRARPADRTMDPRRVLAGHEASVRVLLGDHEEAVALLKEYLTVNPDHRRGFANRTGWWWRDLQSNPRFQTLIAGL